MQLPASPSDAAAAAAAPPPPPRKRISCSMESKWAELPSERTRSSSWVRSSEGFHLMLVGVAGEAEAKQEMWARQTVAWRFRGSRSKLSWDCGVGSSAVNTCFRSNAAVKSFVRCGRGSGRKLTCIKGGERLPITATDREKL
ncbi:unnamed protein product, partial [Ectocarpus sp. 4 AP-2014]